GRGLIANHENALLPSATAPLPGVRREEGDKTDNDKPNDNDPQPLLMFSYCSKSKHISPEGTKLHESLTLITAGVNLRDQSGQTTSGAEMGQTEKRHEPGLWPFVWRSEVPARQSVRQPASNGLSKRDLHTRI